MEGAISNTWQIGSTPHRSPRDLNFDQERSGGSSADADLRGSMGRVASSGDNAAMESFLSLLQKNVLDQQAWRTREELRLAMIIWIERTYNRRRRQRRLGKLTPLEFELALHNRDPQAA